MKGKSSPTELQPLASRSGGSSGKRGGGVKKTSPVKSKSIQSKLVRTLYVLSILSACALIASPFVIPMLSKFLAEKEERRSTGLDSLARLKVASFNPAVADYHSDVFEEYLSSGEQMIPTGLVATSGGRVPARLVFAAEGEDGSGSIKVVKIDEKSDLLVRQYHRSNISECLPVTIAATKPHAKIVVVVDGNNVHVHRGNKPEIAAVIPGEAGGSVSATVNTADSKIIPIVMKISEDKKKCDAFYMGTTDEIKKIVLDRGMGHQLFFAPNAVALGDSNITVYSWLIEACKKTIYPRIEIFDGTKPIALHNLNGISVDPKAKHGQTTVPFGKGKLIQVVGQEISYDGSQLSVDPNVTVAIYDINYPEKSPIIVTIPNAYFAGDDCGFPVTAIDGDEGFLITYIQKNEQGESSLHLQHYRSDGSNGKYHQTLKLPPRTVSVSLNASDMKVDGYEFADLRAVTLSAEGKYATYRYKDSAWKMFKGVEKILYGVQGLNCAILGGAGCFFSRKDNKSKRVLSRLARVKGFANRFFSGKGEEESLGLLSGAPGSVPNMKV